MLSYIWKLPFLLVFIGLVAHPVYPSRKGISIPECDNYYQFVSRQIEADGSRHSGRKIMPICPNGQMGKTPTSTAAPPRTETPYILEVPALLGLFPRVVPALPRAWAPGPAPRWRSPALPRGARPRGAWSASACRRARAPPGGLCVAGPCPRWLLPLLPLLCASAAMTERLFKMDQ